MADSNPKKRRKNNGGKTSGGGPAGRGRTSSRKGASGEAPELTDPSEPKTTRPPAKERRELPEPGAQSTARVIKARKFDAVPDRVDLRDWPYRPPLVPLPDKVVNCGAVPRILDQGQEGACTGFALAAVINYLLAERGVITARQQERFVSPRMLYEMARKYDEWPGEDYEGSSARGGMMGWVAHGVCTETSWPKDEHGVGHMTQKHLDEALETPGGAFYRVSHREVRDMHAALHEVGILYMTLMVHNGWFWPGVKLTEKQFDTLDENGKLPGGEEPKKEIATVEYRSGPGNYDSVILPVIQRVGKADSGHAVAIVGYTEDGFIIQNSWGEDWGAGGFALLPYEDYMLHATDVWVAQLGVPVKLNLWAKQQRLEGDDTASGISRATRAIPLNDIRPFIVDIGNDGRLSNSGEYWTSPEDLARLVRDSIPTFARENEWKKKRVLLYLHGGLNEERAVASRVIAFRDVFLANEIYPVHVMWETGMKETLRNILQQFLTGPDHRAGGFRDWVDKFREGLVEAKDRSLEVTLARPGRAVWGEMKENARLASESPDGKGGMEMLAAAVRQAGKTLAGADKEGWELHVIGHSAGSIFAAHALRHLLGAGMPPLKTLQFFAPAITVQLFRKKILPRIKDGTCPMPSNFVLSDNGERDDGIGPYGKSLLYLVSNSFEPRDDEDPLVAGEYRQQGYVPLLGMECFLRDVTPRDDNTGRDRIETDMEALFRNKVDGRPSLVVAGETRKQNEVGEESGSVSQSDTHGGFDNDYQTLNSALCRILGTAKINRAFTTRDLQY
jgi:hypothetical protein